MNFRGTKEYRECYERVLRLTWQSGPENSKAEADASAIALEYARMYYSRLSSTNNKTYARDLAEEYLTSEFSTD